MEILNRIKFDGPPNNAPWIIYKVPQEGIILGSQLVVGPGQEALFVKSGRVQDVFASGTYTLESGNLPFLSKMIKMPFGGKTPFTAEIYYLNKTISLKMKWGTSAPISVEDTKYGILLNLRAFGQYGIKIVDGRLFLQKLIGVMQLDSGYNHSFLNQQFISIINTKFKVALMRFLREHQISFLEIAEYYDTIGQMVVENLENQFFEYGIELINFCVESIKPPKEEYEKLRMYKEELALGEQFYTKRRSFDVLESVAGSPVGGMVGAGIGFGAGMYAAPSVAMPIEQLASNIDIQNRTSTKQRCSVCKQFVEENSIFCQYCGAKIIQEKICPVCGNQCEKTSKFCSQCGTQLVNQTCSNCGTPLTDNAKFCAKCGRRCE